MKSNKKEPFRVRKIIGCYNALINIFWSVVCLVPISVFCFTLVNHWWLYTFIAASLIPMFLPNAFYDRIQLGNTPAAYKRLGVTFVNRLSQNGTLIHFWIKKRYPHYKAMSLQKKSINRLVQQTYGNEKFHAGMFVFFILNTSYAVFKGEVGWTIVLLATNVVYNLYPILLQKYIRLRLAGYKNHKDAPAVKPTHNL